MSTRKFASGASKRKRNREKDKEKLALSGSLTKYLKSDSNNFNTESELQEEEERDKISQCQEQDQKTVEYPVEQILEHPVESQVPQHGQNDEEQQAFENISDDPGTWNAVLNDEQLCYIVQKGPVRHEIMTTQQTEVTDDLAITITSEY